MARFNEAGAHLRTRQTATRRGRRRSTGTSAASAEVETNGTEAA